MGEEKIINKKELTTKGLYGLFAIAGVIILTLLYVSYSAENLEPGQVTIMPAENNTSLEETNTTELNISLVENNTSLEETNTSLEDNETNITELLED